MESLKIRDVLGKSVLVTRESARSMERELVAAFDAGRGRVQLDFSGVEGLTPSFLDEMLAVLAGLVSADEEGEILIRIVNPPTRLTAKFEAVGRTYDLTVTESEGGWLIGRQRTMSSR